MNRTVLFRPLLALALALTLGAATLPGCGGEDEGDDCPAEGASVDGLQGVVLTPNCAAPMSGATVTALHGSGATQTVLTNAQGEFAIPSAQLGGNTGRWGLSVQKGPFSAPRRDVTVAADGTSGFVVIQVEQ